MAKLKWTVLLAIFMIIKYAYSIPDDIETPNKRILLISNSERGQANIFLATSQALLTNYPSVEIHWLSFPGLSDAVATVSESTAPQNAHPIIFHQINGTAYLDKVAENGINVSDLPRPPGVFGALSGFKNLPTLYVPWNGSEYMAIYNDITRTIEKVDPGLVVLDTMFTPAQDAVRQLQREHVLLSPNSLRDFSVASQPRGEMFWKFPVSGTGFPFPLPWHLIPSNIFVWTRVLFIIIYSTTFGHLRELTTYRQAHGIDNPINLHTSLTQESALLVASVPEIEYPMIIPSNIIPCGPIVSGPTSQPDLDPEFLSWLESAPTVVINLGSHFRYDEDRAVEIVHMINLVLSQSDVQVLWKFNKEIGANYSDDFLSVLSNHTPTRLRILSWIPGNLGSLLNSVNITCLVHHGGASSFHEATAAGVPQVVLPLWWDTYEYTTQAEWLGVGVGGNRKHAPNVNADEVSGAVLKILDSESGRSIRNRASEVASWFKDRPGRDVAAEHIVRMLSLAGNRTGQKQDPWARRDEL